MFYLGLKTLVDSEIVTICAAYYVTVTAISHMLLDEPQNFPVVCVQDADMMGSSTATPVRSFPDLDEPRSIHLAVDASRSQPSKVESLTSEMVDKDGRGSFPAIEVQSITSRRTASFRRGRRSFPAPELRDSDMYSKRVALPRGPSKEREAEIHLQGSPVYNA